MWRLSEVCVVVGVMLAVALPGCAPTLPPLMDTAVECSKLRADLADCGSLNH